MMTIEYAPFDEPVLCWAAADTVILQPIAPRWLWWEGKPLLIECVHITIGQEIKVIVPRTSVRPTAGKFPVVSRIGIPFVDWNTCLAPEPWGVPPPPPQ